MNNKGFTLVELLAAISILAIISIIAVPNVIGIINKNRKEAYINDAKILISKAEYEKRKGNISGNVDDITKIDTSDIDESPSGKSYTVFTYDFSTKTITLTDGCYTVSGNLDDLNGDSRLSFVTKNASPASGC